MKTEIKNLTPHEVTILAGDGTTNLVVLAPSGNVARVSVTRGFRGSEEHQGVAIPCYRSEYGPVVGLPEPAPGVVYLVSALVRLASPGRADVVSPGELVRDAAGQPVGCKGVEI